MSEDLDVQFKSGPVPKFVIPVMDGDYNLKQWHMRTNEVLRDVVRLGLSLVRPEVFEVSPAMVKRFVHRLPTEVWTQLSIPLYNPGEAYILTLALGLLRRDGIQFDVLSRHDGAVRVWCLDWSFHHV